VLPGGHHVVEGGASSRAVKGGVEPPHSTSASGVANGYDFFDPLQAQLSTKSSRFSLRDRVVGAQKNRGESRGFFKKTEK
jgi:hypothetical protein